MRASEERLWLDRVERARSQGAGGVALLIDMLSQGNWTQRRRLVAELATLGDLAIQPLCRVLREDRADEAKNAATVDALVATVGDPATALIELTAHPLPPVAADAALILGRRRERRALPALAKLSTGADDNVAVAAIEALGRIGGRSAVESLITLVRSGNFFRTFPAIDVLGRSGDPRAIAPLSALLQDSRYALEAMRALSRTADRGAVPALASMLHHASPTHVRVAAAALADLADAYEQRYGESYVIGAALEQAAEPGALRALSSALAGADDEERRAIARVLGMLRNQEAVSVLSTLVDGPETVAKAAVLALEALGPKVTGQLLSLLRKGDSLRRTVVLPLIDGGMNSADDIQQCLSDPDGQVRALAAQALARIGAVRAVPALFLLLEDPNARVVQAAVAAIQSLGGPDTESLTLAAARSAEPRTRREALRIIRYFGYRSALPIALPLLDADDERLREAAISALSLIDDPLAVRALVQQAAAENEKTRAMAVRALGQGIRSDDGDRALLRGMKDPDPWVRYYAAQALGRLSVHQALPVLVEALGDAAPQVRISAVEALSHLSSPEAFEALRTAARSAEPDVRRAAVLGFGTLKSEGALPILLAALESEDAATRLVAASALGHFETPAAVLAIGRAANDDDENVRLTAIGLLAEMRSKEATLALIRLLPEYRNLDRVRMALSAASPGRVEGIVVGLVDADDETASILASALARMRTPDALAALIDGLMLPSAAARKAVATALGAVGSEAALETLRAAARHDPDPEVQKVSALAAARR
jgi:HEAT repeat protein